MSETRLSVRVDSTTKTQAEAVFNALGMNMSTGINVYLAQVARSRSIPFALELHSDPLEQRMQDAVRAEVSALKAAGIPVAMYDELLKRPYLEYPDGRRVYDFE